MIGYAVYNRLTKDRDAWDYHQELKVIGKRELVVEDCFYFVHDHSWDGHSSYLTYMYVRAQNELYQLHPMAQLQVEAGSIQVGDCWLTTLIEEAGITKIFSFKVVHPAKVFSRAFVAETDKDRKGPFGIGLISEKYAGIFPDERDQYDKYRWNHSDQLRTELKISAMNEFSLHISEGQLKCIITATGRILPIKHFYFINQTFIPVLKQDFFSQLPGSIVRYRSNLYAEESEIIPV